MSNSSLTRTRPGSLSCDNRDSPAFLSCVFMKFYVVLLCEPYFKRKPKLRSIFSLYLVNTLYLPRSSHALVIFRLRKDQKHTLPVRRSKLHHMRALCAPQVCAWQINSIFSRVRSTKHHVFEGPAVGLGLFRMCSWGVGLSVLRSRFNRPPGTASKSNGKM